MTVEQPPTPPNSSGTTGSSSEPDLPKPPIWERQIPATPPIDIPRAAVPPNPAAPPNRPVQVQPAPPAPVPPAQPQVRATPAPPAQPQVRTTPPIVPDITRTTNAIPAAAAPSRSIPPAGAPAMAPGSSQSFTERSYLTPPASGAGVSDRPQWPTTPPMVGHVAAGPTSPKTPADGRPKRRIGLLAIAVLLAAAVAAGGFFFGRSVSSSESTTTPIAAAPATADPTTVPPATEPPATEVPAPTEAPVLPPVNDAPSPVLPGEGADEPVAAAAQAVAPAVVLIQNDLGQGSGIIYDQSGLILTNAHVVGQFTEVTVTLASGVRIPGQVLGADPLTDVAVVSIDTESEFGVAVLAPESSVEVGQLAVAIGSPFGLEQTVTSGVVSAKGRVLQNPIDDGRLSVVAMIQTDAPINPGNSGGALADRQGRVIGMNTSIRTDGSGGNIGVGFAIPSDTAKLIADRIIAGEPLEQGFLGINGGTPIIGDPGVVVGEVTVGSGAAFAGLQAGDLITGFNEIEIKSMSDLAAAVRLEPPDATVVIKFVRDGNTLEVDVTLGLLEDQ